MNKKGKTNFTEHVLTQCPESYLKCREVHTCVSNDVLTSLWIWKTLSAASDCGVAYVTEIVSRTPRCQYFLWIRRLFKPRKPWSSCLHYVLPTVMHELPAGLVLVLNEKETPLLYRATHISELSWLSSLVSSVSRSADYSFEDRIMRSVKRLILQQTEIFSFTNFNSESSVFYQNKNTPSGFWLCHF